MSPYRHPGRVSVTLTLSEVRDILSKSVAESLDLSGEHTGQVLLLVEGGEPVAYQIILEALPDAGSLH